MTLVEIVRLVAQFISWSEDYLATHNDTVAAWIKFFTDSSATFNTKTGFWASNLTAWLAKFVSYQWITWIEPALNATRAGLVVWSDFSTFVFSPLQGIIHTFLTTGVGGLLSLTSGLTGALDLVRNALLNARSVVVPWVQALENYILHGLTDAYNAHETSRAKLNALVGWADYFFLPSGLIRDVPLMESLQKWSPAAVSVLLGTGQTGDEADRFAALKTTYPPRDFVDLVGGVEGWVINSTPALTDALSRVSSLTGGA
jgi:hypothetical protein